ncbi:MAG: alpha-E domain-containing protein, partial [Ilumatobacteraceae bacterium]
MAGRIYWAARYLERAEDTARLLRAHGEVAADLPPTTPAHWEPLITIVGSDGRFAATLDGNGHQAPSQEQRSGRSRQRQAPPTTSRELAVARFLVADRHNPSSVASAVMTARENLRTTRDTVPRDGWHALNDLYLYVSSEADRAIDRRMRERFLYRVIADSRRLDGILATAMT